MKKGFTFVETTVVIALVGLLSWVFFPGISRALEVKQSSTYVDKILMRNATNLSQAMTGLNNTTVSVYWVGATGAATNMTAVTLGEVDATNMPGLYNETLNATVTGTVGPLVVYTSATGAETFRSKLDVVANLASDVYGKVDTEVDAILADTGTDGVVVASGSKTGYTAAVSNGGITTGSFGSGAIDAAAIATDALGAAELAADAGSEIGTAAWATTTRTLSTGAITTGSFGAGATLPVVTSVTNGVTVTTNNDKTGYTAAISNSGITSGTYAAGAITASAIATDAIGAAELAADAATEIGTADWATTTRTLSAGAITTGSFGAGAIDAAAIATGAVDADAVADNAIDAGAIATDAIGAAEIAADAGTELGTANWATTTRTLSAGAITTGSFAAGAIDASAVATDAIGAAELAADAATEIGTANWVATTRTLSGGAITTGSFAAGAIDASAIAANAITSSEAPNLDAAITSRGTSTLTAAIVWQTDISGYSTGGQAGTYLKSAGAAADPWLTALPGAYESGSAGYIIGHFAAATDPWGVNIPGSYTTGQAGYIVGNNLNASISSRSSHSAADVWSVATRTLSNGGITSGTFAAGAITSTGAPNLDVAVSTRGTSNLTASDVWTYGSGRTITAGNLTNPQAFNLTGNITGSVSGTIGSVTGAVGSITGVTFPGNFSATNITSAGAVKTQDTYPGNFTAMNITSGGQLYLAGTQAYNVTGNVLGNVTSVTNGVTLASSAVQAIWDALTSALTTVNSIGKLIVDNLNAAITSRMATFTVPGNFSSMKITSDGNVTVGTASIDASDVWSYSNRTLSSDISVDAADIWNYNTTNTTGTGLAGTRLNAAGSAGDPWTVDVSSGYTGQAGEMLRKIDKNTKMIR